MEKIALITGGSKGIGKALAEEFARDGYSLILVARDSKALQGVQSDLQTKYACEVKILSADLEDPKSVDLILETFKTDLPNIDVLVNNAAYGIAHKFTDIPLEVIDGMMNVNIVMLTNLMHKFLLLMVSKGRGKIMNVASTAAFLPGPYFAVYYASKAYVVSLSLALAEEYKKDGIQISVLCPGPTETEFHVRAETTAQDLPFLRVVKKMSSEQVARLGYAAFMKNKRLIIPGGMNKLSALTPRLLSTKLVTWISGRLNKANK